LRSLLAPLVLLLALGARAEPAPAGGEDAAEATAPPAGAEPAPVQSRLVDENVGYGALFMRTQSLLDELRLAPLPLGTTTMHAGDVEANLAVDWSNTFGEKQDFYFVDYETVRISLRISYALTDNLSFLLDVSALNRSGGALDGFIEWFHRFSGLGASDRNAFPRNQHIIRFRRHDGGVSQADTEALGFEDLALTARYQFTRGGAWLPAIEAALSGSAPTGDTSALLGAGSPAVAVSVSASKGFIPRDEHDGSWIYGYAGVAFAYYGAEEVLGIRLRNESVQIWGALELRVLPSFSLVGQVLIMNGATSQLPNFDKETYELGAGIRWEFYNGATFEFGILENLINLDPSPDFGWHFGLSYRF
jgi:hypothetical protein